MNQKDRALTGSQQQQEPKQMTIDTAARHRDGPVDTYSCATVAQDLRLNYPIASMLRRSDLLGLFLVVPLAGLKTTFRTSVVVDLSTIVQDPDFDARLISIKFKSILCCPKAFQRNGGRAQTVMRCKFYYGCIAVALVVFSWL